MPYKAKIMITLKSGVLDPQGKATEGALHALGYTQVDGLRIGKYVEMVIQESDETKAKQQAQEMCQKLLANTVIESFKIQLEPVAGVVA